MGDPERRDLLASIVDRLSTYSEGELERVLQSMAGIERERDYKFEELRIPVEGEHRAELDDLDDQEDVNDVIHLKSVEDYDEWHLRNYGGEG